MTTSSKAELLALLELESDMECRVVKSTKDTIYIVIPHKDYLLNQSEVIDINAAGTVGTTGSISSAGTASTAGTVCASFSTASSAASIGSAGTADL
ncbi:hypothetical protein SPONN_2807 [uncultured Candidatus Thioglobus sp.]|nr:hypothetical protein SPONN_2807 [uncultured Candidatus Thioglobus sp.]